MKKRQKRAPIGTSWLWNEEFPMQIHTLNEASGKWELHLVHPGEVGTIVAKKRVGREVDYVVLWPNGHTTTESEIAVETRLGLRAPW